MAYVNDKKEVEKAKGQRVVEIEYQDDVDRADLWLENGVHIAVHQKKVERTFPFTYGPCGEDKPARKKAGGKAASEMSEDFVIGEGVDLKGCRVMAQGPEGVVVLLPVSQIQLLIPAEYIHHHRVEEGKMEPDVSESASEGDGGER